MHKWNVAKWICASSVLGFRCLCWKWTDFDLSDKPDERTNENKSFIKFIAHFIILASFSFSHFSLLLVGWKLNLFIVLSTVSWFLFDGFTVCCPYSMLIKPLNTCTMYATVVRLFDFTVFALFHFCLELCSAKTKINYS